MHYSKKDKELRIYFTELGGYDDMELLYERFEKNLNAKVYHKIEGPYSKIWKIAIRSEKFKLIVDEDYGSMLVAEDSGSIELAKNLEKELEKFIQ